MRLPDLQPKSRTVVVDCASSFVHAAIVDRRGRRAEAVLGENDVATPTPIQEGLFTWPSEQPQLIASRCSGCSELTFPYQDACPACARRECEEVLLSRRGVLWSFTIQRFPPPPPFIGEQDRSAYQPFGVGYVELPEGIRVEGRLSESDPEKLSIGMEMELAIETFAASEDGGDFLTFAFRPVA
jgi:uncharacterized OB-fold protein